MRFSLFVGFLLFFIAACSDQPAPPESVYLVQNVLMPLEPPLHPGVVQSRAIRTIDLPADLKGQITSVRLKKAEIGNPDFPDFGFTSSLRLFLVDSAGQVVRIAESGPVSAGQASVVLHPSGELTLRRFFSLEKLDLVLEADNTLSREEGIMLIGNFEFAYR